KAKELPDKASASFAAAIFELGLKHSSPKASGTRPPKRFQAASGLGFIFLSVLMKLMPPKANSLTTEHIKSRLQKYRLHAHRSKEEFLEFFGLRLEGKVADFLRKEGWRSLSPSHGREGQHDGPEYDSAGGGDGWEGGGGGGQRRRRPALGRLASQPQRRRSRLMGKWWATSATWARSAYGSSSTCRRSCGSTSPHSSSSKRRSTSTSPPPPPVPPPPPPP
ncbi:unnamed protein product, partial [Ectocarpus sp. 8 AP-2014]